MPNLFLEGVISSCEKLLCSVTRIQNGLSLCAKLLQEFSPTAWHWNGIQVAYFEVLDYLTVLRGTHHRTRLRSP
jgi:hypothetical protein